MNAVAQENSTPLLALAALSVEFVAAPKEALRVRETIPAAVDAALRAVSGYAGCMVLVSEQEARLVTVMTLWNGPERAARCNENAKWVKAILTPYVDRWLRTQLLLTSVTGMQQVSPSPAADVAG